MFCCRGSNVPSSSCATPSAASSTRDSTPDFRTRVTSPVCFENLRAPPLQGTERIMYQERPTKKLGRPASTEISPCFEIIPRRSFDGLFHRLGIQRPFTSCQLLPTGLSIERAPEAKIEGAGLQTSVERGAAQLCRATVRGPACQRGG